MTQLPFDLTVPSILRLAQQTVTRPKEVAAMLLQTNLPVGTLWLILATITVVSALANQVTALVIFGAEGGQVGAFGFNPLVLVAVQLCVLVITIQAVLWIGKVMGGKGTLAGVMSLITWLQVVMFLVQLVQSVSMVLSPGFVGLVTLAGFILFLYLFTHFVAAAHGFESLPLVFVMILVSIFAISFALMLVLSMMGVSMEVSGGL